MIELLSMDTTGAMVLRSVTSATTLLAAFATPANGGVLPQPVLKILAHEGSALGDISDEESLVPAVNRPVLCHNESVALTCHHQGDMFRGNGDAPRKAAIDHFNIKERSLHHVEHRSLVTACILSLWRAYGHDDGIHRTHTQSVF